MTEELIDLLSATGEPAGMSKTKPALHRDGDWRKIEKDAIHFGRARSRSSPARTNATSITSSWQRTTRHSYRTGANTNYASNT